MVLLKNQNQTLPLSKSIKNIAVIGPLAESRADMIGSWSGAGDGNSCVSLLEGIKNKMPNANVFYLKGCELEITPPKMESSLTPAPIPTQSINEAIQVANQSELVIVAVGERGWMTGEASSRADINLPGAQEELVKALVKTGKKVVVVLINGRPLTFPWIADNAPAILETWFAGTQGGNAIADVLFGDYNPSGKLTMTFPRSVGQVPIFYSMKPTGRPFDPNNKYTSKYMDAPNTPQYPFGFGLSYTTFEYSDMAVSKNTFGFNEKITVSVNVKNTGNYDGEEVVQLYVRDLVGSITRPLKELKGFKKLKIKKGETQTVSFTISSDDLAFYHPNLERKAEAGEFNLMIGTNSDDVKTVKVTLK